MRLQLKPLMVVLHSTLTSEPHVLALSRANHPNDDAQMSHHMLITRHGRHLWLVPGEKRAIDRGMPA